MSLPRTPTTIDGIWQLVRAELEGESAPDFLPQKIALELSLGFYLVRFGGEVSDAGTYVVECDRNPPSLTLRGTAGPNADREIPCLFQQAGDLLRICYGLNGLRPTEFTTAAGQPRYLASYRRRPLAGR